MASNDQGLKIAGLVVNLFIPGVGTLIAGGEKRKKTGIYQLILFIVGVILTVVLIGGLLTLAAWIWALVTSIQMLQEK